MYYSLSIQILNMIKCILKILVYMIWPWTWKWELMWKFSYRLGKYIALFAYSITKKNAFLSILSVKLGLYYRYFRKVMIRQFSCPVWGLQWCYSKILLRIMNHSQKPLFSYTLKVGVLSLIQSLSCRSYTNWFVGWLYQMCHKKNHKVLSILTPGLFLCRKNWKSINFLKQDVIFYSFWFI